jgi:hypothetical protein
MGTLLSTPDINGNGKYGRTGEKGEAQETKEKRKRRTDTREVGLPPSKRRRKGTSTSTLFNDSTVAKNGTRPDGELSHESADTNSSTNIFPLVDVSVPAKKRVSRVRNLENHSLELELESVPQQADSGSNLEAVEGSIVPRNEISAKSKANHSYTIETPSSNTKHRRKRKVQTSPYFDPGQSQLSSPPPTPTPPTPPKSKISIIEAPGVLPSLPHFRPTSENEFGLIQEKLRHEPWKMLVAVIFLNVTTAKMALPLLAQFFKRWPSPEALSQGSLLACVLYPYGS